MLHAALDPLAEENAGRPRPMIVGRNEYERHRGECRTLQSLLDIAEQAVRDRPALLDRVLRGYRHASAVRSALDYRREPVGRFDTLIDTEGTARFLEYNPGLCGGAFDAERIGSASLAVMREADPRAAKNMRLVPTGQLFIDSIWRGCHAAIGRPPLYLALILPSSPWGRNVVADPEVAEFVAAHVARGGGIFVGNAHEVDRQERHLRLRGDPVDAMIVMDWETTLDECPPDHPLRAAQQARASWIVNDFGAAVMRGGKHLFALLSDPAFDLPLGRRQRKWIGRHIPWTRLVPPWGSDAQLIESIVENRQQLILKPSIGRGGNGVTAGWTVTPHDWQEAIRQAQTTPHIVQARIASRQEPPFWRQSETAEEAPFIADRCAFQWLDGSIDGLLTRAGTYWLLNVRAGHSRAVPTFIRG